MFWGKILSVYVRHKELGWLTTSQSVCTEGYIIIYLLFVDMFSINAFIYFVITDFYSTICNFCTIFMKWLQNV